jgi:predicted MFS family arabinose efflux permease
MSTPQQLDVERSLRSRLFLPVLILGEFLTFTFFVFFINAMVNVASTLKVTVGTDSQILTLSNFVGLIVGLAVGFLTVRFKHKSLFLVGAASYAVGALGCFFAPDFPSMLFFNIFIGIGGTMIGIMVFALIGDFLLLQKKGLAVGLTLAAGTGLASLIMPQLTSLVTNALGWRAVLLWVILPISVACLLFGFFVLPSKPRQEQATNKPQYVEAFKQILTNKSAVACVVGTALMWISFLVPTYAVSFFRLHFHESLTTGTIFYSLASAMLILGDIVGGRLINRIGRNPLTVTAGVIQGIAAVLIVFVPNAGISVVMWMVSAAFSGVMGTALTGLVLEQVPGFRGTMVSLNTSFRYIGSIVGLSISGLVLNLYLNNFQILYPMFGAAGEASAAVVFFLAKDPCKPQLPSAA